MKYISFFDDGEYYYCYSPNGKFYKGKNSAKFTPDFKYFISITITIYIGKILNEMYGNIHNKILCIGIIFLSVILSIIFGVQTYKKIMKKAETELKEVWLSKEDIKTYLVKGKKQFEFQALILYVSIISCVFLFISFYLFQNIFLLLFGAIFTYMATMLFPWINPFEKHKFFKTEVDRFFDTINH